MIRHLYPGGGNGGDPLQVEQQFLAHLRAASTGISGTSIPGDYLYKQYIRLM